MDKLQFHYSKSIFKNLEPQWWNPKLSHINKYRNGLKENGPKFLGSTTIFVWVTDAWHFFQLIMIYSVLAAISLASFDQSIYNIILNFILIRIVYGATFELFFSYLLNNK